MAPLRIGFDRQIFCLMARGGISRHFHDLISGLADAGDAPGGGVRPLRPMLLFRFHANRHLQGPGLVRLPSLGYRLLRRLGCDPAAGPSRLAGIDLLHATYYLGLPPQQPPCPLVSTLHDMTPERWPQFFPRGSPHGAKLAWFAASSRIVSISASSAAQLSEIAPALADRLRVIHLATGFADQPPTPVAGLPRRPFFLYVGRREGYKNSDRLLEALARLDGDDAAPQLLLVGGGPLRAAERRRLRGLGLQGRVRAQAADDGQLAWLYRHCRAVLVPSLAEGFSLPLIEALACDAPVIASDLTVHREIGGSFCDLLDPGDTEAWVTALRDRARQITPSRRLGPRALAERRRYYSLERLRADHRALYRSLA
jgi:glycosyltransferase involved in cell wall biosynthesis